MLLNITLFLTLGWITETFCRTLTSTPDIDSVISGPSDAVAGAAFLPGQQQSQEIIELDIMVKKTDHPAGRNNHTTRDRQGRKRRSYSNKIEPWPNATMYYQLSVSFYQLLYTDSFWSNFFNVVDEIHDLSCVKIVERGKEPNYVSIETLRDCWSMLGMMSGRQVLSLPYRCHTKPTILHELLHALGFKHEQSRADRDEHIRVLEENMRKSSISQFEKINLADSVTFGSPYDYESVMHYGAYFYSMNGGKTIETLDPHYQYRIGKYRQMSREDIFQLNALYNCPPTTKFDLTASKGEIVSPKYPDNYPPDIWREWRITVPTGIAQIKSLDFDLEETPNCNGDYMEIFDGHTVSDPSLGFFCGSSSLQVVGSGRRLMVRFFSDEIEARRGFKLSYLSVVATQPRTERTTPTTPTTTTPPTTTPTKRTPTKTLRTTTFSTATNSPICRSPKLKDGEFIEDRLGENGPWTNIVENLIINCKPGYIAAFSTGVITCVRGDWVVHRDIGCLLAPTTITTTTATTTAPPTTPAICRSPFLKDGEIMETRSGPLNGIWTNAFETLTLRCGTGYTSTIPFGYLTCRYGNWVRQMDPGCIKVITTTIAPTTVPPTTPALCRMPPLEEGEIIVTRLVSINEAWTNVFETLTLECDLGYTATIPFGLLTCTYGNWVRQRDPGCVKDVCRAPPLQEGEIIESRTGPADAPWTNEAESIILSCDTGYTASSSLGLLSCTYGNWVRQRDPGCIKVRR